MSSTLKPDKPLTGRAKTNQLKHIAGLRASALERMTDSPRASARQTPRYALDDLTRIFAEKAKRCRILNPRGKGEELAEYFESLIENINTDQFLVDRGERILASRGAGEDAAKAMALRAEAVTTSIRNLLLADMGWSGFFDVQSLGDSDWPMYEVSVPQEVLVETIGLDGDPQMVQAILDKRQYPVQLFPLFTEWFEYEIRDLYKGSRVKELALANIDMERDFAHAVESLLAGYTLVGGANSRLTAAFDTTNADLKLRDFVTHSRVDVSNLPAGNLVTLSTNSTTTNFRKEVLDAALAYAEQFGADVDGTGPLQLEAIRVCSKDVGAWRSQVTLTSESNSLTEQIFSGGAVVSYAGQKFILEGDNTISPNDGVAYCRFNKRIGTQYDKPSMADTLIDETPERVRLNQGRMCQGGVLGFAMARTHRKNMLGIRYRTPQ